VDLAFREPEGWVLVDYKTDKGDDPDFETRRLGYREQLRRYGDAWTRLTGEPVKERVILWTRRGEQEAVTP
jgi:ATP-dependent helicase/nuclease subunit A